MHPREISGIAEAIAEPLNEWTEVRRSTPAEELEGVPDAATIWKCWTKDDMSVTIYHDETAGEDDPPWYTTFTDAGTTSIETEAYTEDSAMSTATTLRMSN